ncbi:hypothetical protein ACLOJK_017882 [Asimina triloba]
MEDQKRTSMEDQKRILEEVFGESSSSDTEFENERSDLIHVSFSLVTDGEKNPSWAWERVKEIDGLWLCRDFLFPEQQCRLLASIQRGACPIGMILCIIAYPLECVFIDGWSGSSPKASFWVPFWVLAATCSINGAFCSDYLLSHSFEAGAFIGKCLRLSNPVQVVGFIDIVK